MSGINPIHEDVSVFISRKQMVKEHAISELRDEKTTIDARVGNLKATLTQMSEDLKAVADWKKEQYNFHYEKLPMLGKIKAFFGKNETLNQLNEDKKLIDKELKKLESDLTRLGNRKKGMQEIAERAFKKGVTLSKQGADNSASTLKQLNKAISFYALVPKEKLTKKQQENLQRARSIVETITPTIWHLGGTTIPRSAAELFLSEHGFKEMGVDYFFERITIKTNQGEEFHVYKGTLRDAMESWKKEAPDIPFAKFVADKMDKDPKFKDLVLKTKTRYFNDEDRKKTKVDFKEGQLFQIGLDQEGQETKVIKPGKYAFVIGKDDEGEDRLYLARKTERGPNEEIPEKGNVQHSSFFRSGDVRSAGLVTVDEYGKIVDVEGHSGHYLPGDQELMTVMSLLEREIPSHELDNVKVRIYGNSEWKKFMPDKGKSIDKEGRIAWGAVRESALKWQEERSKKSV